MDLVPVTRAEAHFLFRLLKQRPQVANISHQKMPTYPEHVAFVLSEPYAHWYIITEGKKKIGAIYLTKRSEIGIQLIFGAQGQGYGTQALNLIMNKHKRKQYLANVAPDNYQSRKFFGKQGFEMLQHTYKKGVENE